ncbi:integral membrane protein [Astrocystis sublimbata]|nr:integral membrane protein [Astrocystis sublimbata]
MDNDDGSTVAGAILIVVGILTVGCRFYSRWLTKAGFKWDDWTALGAIISGILPGALTIYASTVSSTGPAAASNFDPDYVFTPADVLYTKITFSTTVLYFFITSLTKMSILLLQHRIFAASGSFRIQIFVTEAAVVAFWVSATLADCLNCVPLKWTWENGNADPRYCINYNTFWLVTGIFESVIDLVILALPFTIIFKLQLELGKKFGIAAVFLLGAFVLFSGVAKIALSYLPNSREPYFSRAAVWTVVHLYTGIICANLAPSWPAFSRAARLTTASWMRLSSVSKRLYNLSSGKSTTTDGTVMARRTIGSASSDNVRLADIESGRADYERFMYGGDGQDTNCWIDQTTSASSVVTKSQVPKIGSHEQS